MAMKKIKPQYGKVVLPVVKVQENSAISESEQMEAEIPNGEDETKENTTEIKSEGKKNRDTDNRRSKSIFANKRNIQQVKFD